jgi:hypothetical protein
MVLTSKAPQFLPLSACRPVNALAGIPLGLLIGRFVSAKGSG